MFFLCYSINTLLICDIDLLGTLIPFFPWIGRKGGNEAS